MCNEKRSEANLTRPSSYRYTLRGFRQVTTTYTLRSYCIYITPDSVMFGMQVVLMQTYPAGRKGPGRAGATPEWAGQGRAGQGRAGQNQEEQGRAGHLQMVGNLEAVDGVWVADVVLHQAGLLWGDAAGVRHQLDTPPSR